MKKIVFAILALAAVIAFNGCVPGTITGTPTTAPSYTTSVPAVSGTAPTETITTAPTTGNLSPTTTTQPAPTQPQLTASLPPPTTQAPPSPTATLVPLPSISLNQTTGAPGSSVTITGSGFGVNEAGINVTFDDNSVASGITTSKEGTWSRSFTVPSSASGAHTVTASGSVTGAVHATFTTTAAISLNQTNGRPGTSLTVTGYGFGANEAGIYVTFDGKPIGSGITANAQGFWTVTFVVPVSSFGSHTIHASGSITTSASNVIFTTRPS